MARTELNSKIGSTEYKTVFLTHGKSKPPDSFKPAMKVLSRDVPMTADTTQKIDYIKHLVTPLIPRPPAMYKKPEGSMANESEYKKEYLSKTPEPAKPVLPALNQIRSASQPFQGQSTHTRDFVAYTLPPREFYGERRVYMPPTEPFARTTTVQTDFTGMSLAEPTKSTKPPQAPKLSREPFESSTCHRSDFHPFPLPERFQRPKVAYQPPEDPFQGMTTFANDFPGHRGIKPVSSLKPPVTAKHSDVCFESLTTSRQSYRKWELPPRFSRPPTVYEPPKEKFEAITSFSKDFVHHGTPEPALNYKPQPQSLQHDRPMEQNTSNRLDYQAWDVTNRQQPIRQNRPYEPPVERFEGNSTTSSVYRGVYAQPAMSTKPQLKPYSKGETFERQTTYRDCYSSGGFKPDFITGNPVKPEIPGYEFSHEDTRTGHKFYQPVVATEVAIPISADNFE